MNRLLAHLVFPPALALAFCASACHAEGAYVGAGMLWRHYDLSAPGATGDSSSGSSLSGRWIAGYEFDRTWGLEAGRVDLGRPSDHGGSAGPLSTRGHAWFGAVKASLPLNEKFGVFGKAGLDRIHWEVAGNGPASPLSKNTADTALYLGAGMQYRFSDNLAATLEIERFSASKHPGGTLAGASLGLQFRF